MIRAFDLVYTNDPMRVAARRAIGDGYCYRLRLDPDDRELLRRLLETEKLPISDILRRALRAYAGRTVRVPPPLVVSPSPIEESTTWPESAR